MAPEITKQFVNWHPLVVKAGPVTRFYLDSRTGKLLPVPSDGLATACNRDRVRTSDNESTFEQACLHERLQGFSPSRRDT